MWWTNPLWLLALILIVPFFLYGNILNKKIILNFRKALKEVLQSRIIRLTWLRMISIVFVVLVLAGTYAFLPTGTEEIAALIDVSESIGNTEKEKARSAVLDQIKNMESTDRIAVIAFAGDPNIIVPLSQPDKALNILKSVVLTAPNKDETDLTGAISIAGEILSKSTGKRSIIIFTDGRSTIGGSVLDKAGLSGIPIYTVPIGQPIEGLISRGLKIPNETALGENVYIQWETYSSRDLTIQAKIKLDNKLVRKINYDIKAGNNIIPIGLKAEKSGNHIVDIEVSRENKPVQYGNISGLLIVRDKPGVLIIYGEKLNPALSTALSIQNFRIREQDTKSLPETPGYLNAYSAIILDNVPALFLNKNQQKALQNYTAGGGGLLVIGGEFSLGRGGYYDSILEEILPVNTDTRQRILYDKAEIIYVIDHSDSMVLTKSGNMTKYESALNGVAASVRGMNPQNDVGIVTFDTRARWTLPMTPASRKAEIIRSLSKIPEGGGTDMSKAFEQVIQKFSGLDPVRRHLIVITDGMTMQSDFKALSRELRKIGFTITTIGIGNYIDEPLLREIAKWGEGIFYHVQENDIPRIIKKESVRVTRELIREGGFMSAIKTNTEWINEIGPTFPVIKGYLVTKPKNLAVIILEIGEKDPLLAWWRYGNGKTAVFTSDSGNRWLSSWSGTKYYNLLFSQTIRSIAKGKSDKGLRATAYVDASKAYLIVDAFGEDRNLHSGLQLKGRTSDSYGEAFLFQETAYGRYEAEITLVNKGLNVFNISQEGGNSWTTSWVWNPPGKELDSTGPDVSLLSQLSARTGGRIMNVKRFELPETGWRFEPVSLYYSLLIIALLFFLLELFLRSTSMNQLKAAKTFLLTWWSRKEIIIQKAYNLSKKQVKEEKEQASIYDMD